MRRSLVEKSESIIKAPTEVDLAAMARRDVALRLQMSTLAFSTGTPDSSRTVNLGASLEDDACPKEGKVNIDKRPTRIIETPRIPHRAELNILYRSPRLRPLSIKPCEAKTTLCTTSAIVSKLVKSKEGKNCSRHLEDLCPHQVVQNCETFWLLFNEISLNQKDRVSL